MEPLLLLWASAMSVVRTESYIKVVCEDGRSNAGILSEWHYIFVFQYQQSASGLLPKMPIPSRHNKVRVDI